jgi:RimJ/RimL family protein N-acetyltransferase
MNGDFWKGEQVQLVAPDPEKHLDIVKSWEHDTEFTRLLSLSPVRLTGKAKWKEEMETIPEPYSFDWTIVTRADGRVIGFISLFRVLLVHRNCTVGIGIGDRADWSKGYGSDAMRIVLRFAFQELNMHRVSLDVVASNARAMRSYEKCGFVTEGRVRGANQRLGTREDLVKMGLLRRDWQARQASE